MIYDKMTVFSRYCRLAPELWEKIDLFFKQLSDGIPEAGSFQLDGEKVKVNIVHTKTSPAEQGKYEVHKQYIDIHVPLSGCETIICRSSCSGLTPAADFDTDNDYQLFETAPGTNCFLEPGDFLLLYPGEAHHVLTGDGSPVVKAIVKIDISLLEN